MILRRQLRASFVRHEPSPEDDLRLRRRLRRLAVLLVGAVLLLMLASWIRHSQTQHLRKMLLRQQLWQLRSAVLIYSSRFGAMPRELAVLEQTSVTPPQGGKPIRLMEDVPKNGRGDYLDPLGYPYRFDPTSGTVASTAPCCSNW